MRILKALGRLPASWRVFGVSALVAGLNFFSAAHDSARAREMEDQAAVLESAVRESPLGRAAERHARLEDQKKDLAPQERDLEERLEFLQEQYRRLNRMKLFFLFQEVSGTATQFRDGQDAETGYRAVQQTLQGQARAELGHAKFILWLSPGRAGLTPQQQKAIRAALAEKRPEAIARLKKQTERRIQRILEQELSSRLPAVVGQVSRHRAAAKIADDLFWYILSEKAAGIYLSPNYMGFPVSGPGNDSWGVIVSRECQDLWSCGNGSQHTLIHETGHSVDGRYIGKMKEWTLTRTENVADMTVLLLRQDLKDAGFPDSVHNALIPSLLRKGYLVQAIAADDRESFVTYSIWMTLPWLLDRNGRVDESRFSAIPFDRLESSIADVKAWMHLLVHGSPRKVRDWLTADGDVRAGYDRVLEAIKPWKADPGSDPEKHAQYMRIKTAAMARVLYNNSDGLDLDWSILEKILQDACQLEDSAEYPQDTCQGIPAPQALP
ncbi:MAG: hypothetical protein M3O22_07710 [Pseudomonadota bacterium]|nr:hypothetical protein [Pseudomonadota bacterium]